MKKKTKIIISLILILVILAGVLWGRTYQPPSATYDMTRAQNEETADGETDREEERKAILDSIGSGTDAIGIINPNVTCFTELDSETICDAVETVQLMDDGYEIVLQEEAAPYFENLGSGDIFFLDGGADSPFGEPYFGKIVSVDQGNEIVIYAENPAMDEVFDDFQLEIEEYLLEENIREIRAFDGVSVEVGASLDDVDLNEDYLDPEGFLVTSETDDTAAASAMAYRQTAASDSGNSFVSEEASFLLNIDFDLGKYINDMEGYERIRENEDEETNLAIKGEVGLDRVQVRANADFGVSYDNFIKELSAGARADYVTNVAVGWKAETDFDKLDAKEARKIEFGDAVKISGLDNKLFPLVYIDILTGTTIQLVASGGNDNSTYKALTNIPVAGGIMVYSDISGNISLKTELFFKYRDEIDMGDFVFVRDGQLVMQTEDTGKTEEKDPEYDWGFLAEVQGDVDVDFLGVSALIFVANINVADIALAKVGAEAEGELSLEIGKGGADAEADGYLRIYLKILDIRMKLKASLKLLYFTFSPEFSLSYTLWDGTLYELGEKNSTYFDVGNMNAGQLAAYDKQYVYYKDQNGCLIRTEKNGTGKYTVSEDEFYMICGIDQSYIYQLRCTEEQGIYDVYRVAKDGAGSRLIISNVSWVLYNDSETLFYVPGDNRKQIRKLDRQSLNEQKFVDFSENVELMEYQSDKDTYLVTGSKSGIAAFLGRGSEYYSVTQDGTVTELGGNLEIQDMNLRKEGEYTYRNEPVSSGYLRNSSASYYVMIEGGEAIKTDCLTGWMPTRKGMFTTLKNDQEGSSYPYKIVCYTNQTEPSYIVETESDQAFFTLVQDERGYWYYFDQNDSELFLYRLDENFSNKTLLKSFPRSEVNYNLTDCATVIIDNIIYFYTIPDGESSSMIYRYSIYQEAV